MTINIIEYINNLHIETLIKCFEEAEYINKHGYSGENFILNDITSHFKKELYVGFPREVVIKEIHYRLATLFINDIKNRKTV